MFAAPVQEQPLVSRTDSASNQEVEASESLTPTEADRRALAELEAGERQHLGTDAEKLLLEGALAESAASATPQDPLFQDIERVLAVDLDEYVHSELADKEVLRERFLAQGRQLAMEIYARRTSLKPKDMIHLVRRWLLQIPNVNKHFLAQDAYIKTQMLSSLLQSKPDSLS